MVCNDTNPASLRIFFFKMDLFYLRHHYLSIRRSNSFDGEVLAFILLTILVGSGLPFMYEQLDEYAISVGAFFGQFGLGQSLIPICYVFLDLALRLVFRRPLPKLKYYVLWGNRSSEITFQYLFTSLFGIMPYVLLMSVMVVVIKSNEWMGALTMISIILWWFTNHFIGLIAQFSKPWVKNSLAGFILLLLIAQYFIPNADITSVMLNPVLPFALLVTTIFVAYRLISNIIENREIHEVEKSGGLLESLPVVSFKNPVFQLEWALLVRNKRTRSNLLLGLVSVMILPFLLKSEDSGAISTLIFFIVSGFFIIQHGVYSLGWEGSYFDFLLTNISPKNFIKTRYVFYVMTCIVGLLIASIPTIINGLNWIYLFMIFLYNVGVTIPLVLYRSTFNSTKIVLTENSFMNYNGMLTGPIFITSFLVTLLPLILFGISQVVIAEYAIYALGLMGVVGLALFGPITNMIAANYMKKKYHLSQSFKA